MYDGKYCPYKPYTVTKNQIDEELTPAELIYQALREQCVYEAVSGQTKAHWFLYITKLG